MRQRIILFPHALRDMRVGRGLPYDAPREHILLEVRRHVHQIQLIHILDLVLQVPHPFHRALRDTPVVVVFLHHARQAHILQQVLQLVPAVLRGHIRTPLPPHHLLHVSHVALGHILQQVLGHVLPAPRDRIHIMSHLLQAVFPPVLRVIVVLGRSPRHVLQAPILR